MLRIKKRFIVDENNRPIEVVVDVETFAKIEAALEDYSLGKIMQKAASKERLELDQAKRVYGRMKKRP